MLLLLLVFIVVIELHVSIYAFGGRKRILYNLITRFNRCITLLLLLLFIAHLAAATHDTFLLSIIYDRYVDT